MTEIEEIQKLKKILENHEERISKLEKFLPETKIEMPKKKIFIKEFILQKKPKMIFKRLLPSVIILKILRTSLPLT